jgi:hypothetical protein
LPLVQVLNSSKHQKDKFIPSNPSLVTVEVFLLQKDPGKATKNISKSASIKYHQTEILSPPTHFSHLHQHNFQTFNPPGINQPSLKSMLVSPQKPVKSLKQRIKSISTSSSTIQLFSSIKIKKITYSSLGSLKKLKG